MKFLSQLSKKTWLIITSAVASATVLVSITAFIVSNQYESMDVMPILIEAKETLTLPESTKVDIDLVSEIRIGEYDVQIKYESTATHRIDDEGKIISLPSQKEAFEDVTYIITLSLNQTTYVYTSQIRIFGESKSVQVELYDFEGLITTLNKKEGDSLLLSELIAPNKEGYTFDGYFYDPLYQRQVESTIDIDENFSLYAKYTAYKTLTIYGFEKVIYTNTFPINSSIDLSSIELKSFDGYTFLNFKTFNQEILTSDSLILDADIVLFASYQEYVSLSIFGFDELLFNEAYLVNTSIDLSSIELKSFDGYTFLNFKTFNQEILTSDSLILDADIVLFASYVNQTFDISYIIDSAFENDLEIVTTTYQYQTLFDLPTLNSTTHTIEGFYLDEALTIPFENIRTQLTSNLVLYIQVIQNVFQVTYVESINDSMITLEVSSFEVGEVIELEAINKENHFFIGFKYQDELLDSDDFTMPDQNIQLEALYMSFEEVVASLNLLEEVSTNLTLVSIIEINDINFSMTYMSNYLEDISNAGVILRRPNILDGNKSVSMTISISYQNQSFRYTYAFDILPITTEVNLTYVYLNGDIETQSYELGDTIQVITHKTYEDYVFEGYYIDPNFQTELTQNFMVNQDRTIYAKYTLLRTLTIVNIDGSFTTLKFKNQSMVTLTDLEYALPEGYILNGFLNVSDYETIEETFVISDNMIVFPSYDTNVYTVEFVVDEGVFPELDEVYSIEFTVENQPEELFFDSGIYKTTGFYLDQALTIPFDEEETYLEDLIIYVTYEQYQASITLLIEDGVNYTGDTVFEVPLNESLNALENPYKYGHTFIGWSKNSSDEIIEEVSLIVVTEHMTLTPNFEVLKDISVEFVTNNDEATIIEFYDFLETINYPELSKEGYTFLGWFLDNNTSRPFETTMMDINALKLYAQWSINNYMITIIDDGVVLEQLTLDYGTTLDIELFDGEKEGFRFIGWSEDVPDTMPAYDLIIETQYAPLFNVTYMTQFNVLPTQIIIFEGGDSQEDYYYTSVIIFDGVLFGYGSNLFGSFAFDDWEYDTFQTIEDEDLFVYNISKNLNLYPNETILKINHLYETIYAVTSENRLLRWGMFNEVYLPVEEVDRLDHDVNLLLTGFGSISVITSENEFFSYNEFNDKFEFTSEYQSLVGEVKFANNVSFVYENFNTHDGYSLGYTHDQLFTILDQEDGSLVFDIVPIDLIIDELSSASNTNGVIHIAFQDEIFNVPLFILDNMMINFIDNRDTDLLNMNIEAIMELNLLYGEIIEEVLFFTNEGVMIPSFYTNYQRILSPNITSEIVNDQEVLTFSYINIAPYILFEGETIIDIKDGVLITDSNYMITPFVYSLYTFYEFNTDPEAWTSDDLMFFQQQSRIDISSIAGQSIFMAYFEIGEILTNQSIYVVQESNFSNEYFLIDESINIFGEDQYEMILYMTAEEILNYTPLTNDDYRFDGWYIDEALEIPATIEFIESGMTLYPKFTQTHYQVQYLLHDTFENPFGEDIFLGEGNEGSYFATYEMGEIPVIPDLVLFGNYEGYRLNGDAYLMDFIINNAISYDFDFALDEDVIIYLTIVSETEDIVVVSPDNVSDLVTVATGTYLYDSTIFNSMEPNNQEIEGFYEDALFETRIDENFIVDTSGTFYINYQDIEITVRYVIEKTLDDTVVFEQYDDVVEIFQTQDGSIYLKSPNTWNDFVSPLIHVDQNEYDIYTEFVDVTAYFDLLEGEYITSIIPLNSVMSFYFFDSLNELAVTYFYAITTSMNRVLMSGSHSNEQIVMDMLLLDDYETLGIKGVAFDYQDTNELYVLLEDSSIHRYQVNFNQEENSVVFEWIDRVQTTLNTDMIYLFEIKNRLLFVSTETEVVIYNIHNELSIFDSITLEDDRFIGFTVYYDDLLNDLNISLRILSEKGLEVKYQLNNTLAVLQTKQHPLLDNERFTFIGIFEYQEDEDRVIGLTSNNQMVVLDEDIQVDHSEIFTFDEVLSIEYAILLKNGDTIGIDVMEELVRDTSIDIGESTIETYFITGILKLSDGSYFNLDGAQVYELRVFEFLDTEKTIYTAPSKPSLNTTIEPDDFFGWSITDTEFTNSSNATIITELPDNSTFIYAILID